MEPLLIGKDRTRSKATNTKRAYQVALIRTQPQESVTKEVLSMSISISYSCDIL